MRIKLKDRTTSAQSTRRCGVCVLDLAVHPLYLCHDRSFCYSVYSRGSGFGGGFWLSMSRLPAGDFTLPYLTVCKSDRFESDVISSVWQDAIQQLMKSEVHLERGTRPWHSYTYTGAILFLLSFLRF